MFIGRRELDYSEEEIWSCTPRKFYAMLNVALDYAEAKKGSTGSKKANKVADGYIENIKW